MIADDDPIAQRLREAVWTDPGDDDPRMVFADYLLEQEDPLGELIALQLDRARTGAAIGERELELVVTHGRRMLGPAEIWLQRWVLDRGFLAAATPDERIPVEAATHPMWATVERVGILGTANHPVLNANLQSLRTIHTTVEIALQLSRGAAPLPCVALTSSNPRDGLGFQDDQLEVFDHAGAFDRVRAVSLTAWRLERSLNVRPILESRLFGQLEHLDLCFNSVRLDDLRMWRRWSDSTQLARFSVQVAIAQDPPPEGEIAGPPARYAYLEIARTGDTAILQLDAPTDQRVADALAVVAEVAGDRLRLIVEDTRDSNRTAERHAELIEGLRRTFSEVVVTTGPVRLLAP